MRESALASVTFQAKSIGFPISAMRNKKEAGNEEKVLESAEGPEQRLLRPLSSGVGTAQSEKVKVESMDSSGTNQL